MKLFIVLSILLLVYDGFGNDKEEIKQIYNQIFKQAKSRSSLKEKDSQGYSDKINNYLAYVFSKMLRKKSVMKKKSPTIIKTKKFRTGWEIFKKMNYKVYKNRWEEKLRMRIFLDNVKKINRHNMNYLAGKVGYTMTISRYADLTIEEFNNLFNDYLDNRFGVRYETNSILPVDDLNITQDIPASMDWSKHGANIELTDKYECSSCHMKNALNILEMYTNIKTNKFLGLNISNVIDYLEYEKCKNANPLNVYSYLNETGTLAHYKSIGIIDSNDEEFLTNIVAYIGPVVTSISTDVLQFYNSGIIDDKDCPKAGRYSVMIVGYDTTTDVQNGVNNDYWIVKNCVRKNGGYMKIARNKNNTCGIGSQSFYPIL